MRVLAHIKFLAPVPPILLGSTRALPKRFDMKVTTVEETQHIATRKVDLFGSLLRREKREKKKKRIALQFIVDDQLERKSNDSKDTLADFISLLSK